MASGMSITGPSCAITYQPPSFALWLPAASPYPLPPTLMSTPWGSEGSCFAIPPVLALRHVPKVFRQSNRDVEPAARRPLHPPRNQFLAVLGHELVIDARVVSGVGVNQPVALVRHFAHGAIVVVGLADLRLPPEERRVVRLKADRFEARRDFESGNYVRHSRASSPGGDCHTGRDCPTGDSAESGRSCSRSPSSLRKICNLPAS